MKFWTKHKTTEPLVETLEDAGNDARAASSPEAQRWVGYIDKIDRTLIQGWCIDRLNQSVTLAVEAVGSGGSRAVAIACLYRRDVQESGYGSGHHGFELNVSDFHDTENVTVRFVETLTPITAAPIALDPLEALRTNALPARFLEAARDLSTAVELRYLARANSVVVARSDPYDAGLLAVRDPVTDPEGLITRFLAQEAARIARDAFDLDMAGSLQERLGVLLWFIDDYAAARPAATRVPLSADQVAALNAPAHIAGAASAVTVALHNFVLRHLPTHSDLRNDILLREAVYWWCAEQAPLLRLDDKLVTGKQIEILSTLEIGTGTDFPCTTFMVIYAQRHPFLQDLDLGLPRDRLALLIYLVLASFREPGLLRFLPREALRRLLREHREGVCALDLALGRLASTNEHQDGPAIGREIRRKGEELLSVAGLDLSVRSNASVVAPHPAVDTQPGVAVVGPMAKSSGLGRAMRLSVETLALCEVVTPAVHGFDMENPAPGEAIARSQHDLLDAPREITFLHLNAEALPMALAYGPRHLLAGSRRIGVFFWELNEIPECHRLALDLVDEVWVASEYNRETYARATTKPVIRVGMAAAPLPDIMPASRAEFGLDRQAFVFVTTFDSLSFIARKNPLGTIEAFRRAFPLGDETVQLVVKTQNRGLVNDAWQIDTWRRIDRAIAADPRIVLLNETLAFRDLISLVRSCNAYVSLHRAEGWGFGLIEAMQLGLPVICTGYSGNIDYCTPETAFLVDYGLIPVAGDEYIYVPRGSVWADPCLDTAAAQMRLVVADRVGAASRADAARSFVAREMSLEATARRYAHRLAAIRGRNQGKSGT